MALEVGDKVPDFLAKDSKGNDFDSTSIVGKKTVVFYFYPKDNTPGCTAQACSFRDQYEDFKDLGAEVVGISSDSIVSHEKFSQKYQLPFMLLSDDDKKLRNLFGVKPSLFGLIPGRVTYVVDKKGIIRLVFDSLVATNHIPRALETVQKMVFENT
ncbi:peroxiredoxin [Flavobacterium sp.]|uniref:peroxiredoxin n=1 Tax=Flavobacterium sp. TaxID=239 RepID=UPI0025C336C1|nr:peroxiredoxin [Flavobacterium sp.]MBA4276482.1 peroxiredoxin [Flavobacterium sp.]